MGLGHAETPLFLYGSFALACRLLKEEEGTFVISRCLWGPLFPIQILKDKNKRQRFGRRNQQEMAWSLGTGSGEPQCVGVHPFPWVLHIGDLSPSHSSGFSVGIQLSFHAPQARRLAYLIEWSAFSNDFEMLTTV